MKTIVHIGQHKTGTTSIQHYLQTHRERLIGEGLYVPMLKLASNNPSHFILNIYALAKDRMSPVKEHLRGQPPEILDRLFTDLKAEIRSH